jgi:hypothetical protein
VTGGVVSDTPGKHEAAKVASSLGLQGPAAPIGAQLLQASAAAGPVPQEDHASATIYHANLLAGTSGSVQAALQQPAALLTSLDPAATLASMQASAEASSLDLQTMQSMERLFKNERIYLLAHFWQQVSPTIAPSARGGPVRRPLRTRSPVPRAVAARGETGRASESESESERRGEDVSVIAVMRTKCRAGVSLH